MHSFFSYFCQKHARRVYEILRLRATDMSDEQKAKEYCSEVKKRLFGPYRVSFRIIPPPVQKKTSNIHWMTSRLHDCANDSGMSNLSHVDVKQQPCVQSQCITQAVIERSRMIIESRTLEPLIMLPFLKQKKNRFLFWWKLIDYWSCIVAATKECTRRLVEPFSLFRNVSLAGICIHFEGEIIFRKASSKQKAAPFRNLSSF